MMKIALQKELPGEGQFRQLLESMSGDVPADLPVYEAFCQCSEVIAAYDQGTPRSLRRCGEGLRVRRRRGLSFHRYAGLPGTRY